MKKKDKSRLVRVFNRVINIRAWFDWDRMKSFTEYLISGFKRLFVVQNVPPRADSTTEQSFIEASNKLHLSDEDLLIKQKALWRLSVLMSTIAFFILIYAGYHLFHGALKAALISFVIMLIALVLSFRYHFWYFQIKERKLGLTVRQWYQEGLWGKKE